MTQEQKAKAYDEALNKAKIEINTKGIGETVNLCYQLFPQLAESDDEKSDDERIRKRLIEYFEGFRMGNAEVRWEGLIVQEVLAWLEKQKETSHISEMCKENANSFADGIIEVRSFQRGMEEGRRLEKQKEQKPQTDDEKEYVRTIKSIISDFIRDKKPENLAYYQRIYDWLDGRHVPFSCSHEKGQPADPVFSKQEYESYPIISEDTTSAKPTDLDGKALLHTADKSYQIGFRDGVASVKPEWSDDIIRKAVKEVGLTQHQIDWFKTNVFPHKQEWSEDDEKMLDKVCCLISPGTILDASDADYCLELKQWIVSLQERILKLSCTQPKQEWNEEDEEMMADIIDSLEYAYPYDNEFRIAWLKSLRPQPKKELSIEKAIQWLDDTFYFLDNSSGRGRDCEITTHDFDSLEEMYDSFRKAVTVDSEPRWKPSDEQMEALDKARRFIPYNCDALESLYVDLKKL